MGIVMIVTNRTRITLGVLAALGIDEFLGSRNNVVVVSDEAWLVSRG